MLVTRASLNRMVLFRDIQGNNSLSDSFSDSQESDRTTFLAREVLYFQSDAEIDRRHSRIITIIKNA